MAKSMLAVIAEAAGLNEPQRYAPAFRAAPIQPAPPPARELSLPEQIVQTWKTDAAIRAEFRDLSTYAAWRTGNAAKAAGLSVVQFKAQLPDVNADAYLAKHPQADPAIVRKCAETWRLSPDIRGEFQTFEVFAAYSRANARGNARAFGE